MATTCPRPSTRFSVTPENCRECEQYFRYHRVALRDTQTRTRVAGAGLRLMGPSHDIALALLAKSVRADSRVDAEESVEGTETRSGAAVGASSPSEHQTAETSATAKSGARAKPSSKSSKSSKSGNAKTVTTPKETKATPTTPSTSAPSSSGKKRTTSEKLKTFLKKKSSTPIPEIGRRDRTSVGGGGGGGGGWHSNNTKQPPKRYAEFWPRASVEQGLSDGSLRLGKIRVSAHHAHEAFVSVAGVPHDVKFEGFDARNRTFDGDTVVFAIDPVQFWPKLDDNKWNTPARADGGCAGGRAKQRQRRRAAKAAAAGEVLDDKDTGVSDIARGMGDMTAHAVADDDEDGDDEDDDDDDDDDSETSEIHDTRSSSSPATKLLADAARSGGVNGVPLRPVGRVVAVHELSPRRDVVVGYLDYHDADEKTHAKETGKYVAIRFFPSDPKLPTMFVNTKDAPPEVKAAAVSFKDMDILRKHLVLAQVRTWPAGSSHPTCVVHEVLGDAQDLETATAALIAEHGILGADDFSEEAMRCLPYVPMSRDLATGKQTKKWTIPHDEKAKRRDFTKTRVVSIDPPSARDLDDALHCEVLPDGTLLVGVHIADVSHFVEPNTALDDEARQRGTSTYLTQKVMPMLPRLLCENLCSLNPGVERLTFSAEWEMTADGEVLSEWFGRGVIRSCAKLDYGTAQQVIDAINAGGTGVEALCEAVKSGLDKSVNGPVRVDLNADGESRWDPAAVARAVGGLNRAARAMRRARFAGGALRLDQTKLLFELDKATGSPISTFPYVTREANHLVEEFMLLANAAAARLVSRAFPNKALLRCHPPPNETKLEELAQFAREQGLNVDVSSAKALHDSLVRLKQSNADAYEITQLLATLPMQLARYFCTGTQDLETWGHYALCAPRYTHFTSPIRRYPDVCVHRQIAAALDAGFAPVGYGGGILGEGNDGGGETEKVSKSQKALAAQCTDRHGLFDSETLKDVASHCNERKLAAKAVQDGSSHAFLCAYLRANPRVVCGIVRAAGKKYLRVFIPAFGCEARVEVDGLRHVTSCGNGGGITITFEPTAGEEDLAIAVSHTVPKDARRKAMRNTRGLQGPFLNCSEAQHEALAVLEQEKMDGTTSTSGPSTSDDVFNCGVAPGTLPTTIKPIQRVCLLLGAHFPERAKPEMTATLLLRNPLNATR